MNANKTEYMSFKRGAISTQSGEPLKLVDKFTYLGSSISSTESDVDIRLVKAWNAIDRLSVIWKSDLSNQIKRVFFQAVAMSIPLYGCTKWTQTKRIEKRVDRNYTRMLGAILNKSWMLLPGFVPTKQLLYGHLLRISKTTHVRRSNAGHC